VCPVSGVKLRLLRVAKQCRYRSARSCVTSLDTLLVFFLSVFARSVISWRCMVGAIGSGLKHCDGGVFENASGGEMLSLFRHHVSLSLDQHYPLVSVLLVKSVLIFVIHLQKDREWPFEMTPVYMAISREKLTISRDIFGGREPNDTFFDLESTIFLFFGVCFIKESARTGSYHVGVSFIPVAINFYGYCIISVGYGRV